MTSNRRCGPLAAPDATAPSSYTCVEPSFPGCDQAAFAYASGGTKTVRAHGDHHRRRRPAPGEPPPDRAEHRELQRDHAAPTPSARRRGSFTSAGGTGTISVSTQTGCTWTASEGVDLDHHHRRIERQRLRYGELLRSPPTPARRDRPTSPSRAGLTRSPRPQASSATSTWAATAPSSIHREAPGASRSTPRIRAAHGRRAPPPTGSSITNGSNHTGTGPLNYTVAENDTPHQRVGDHRHRRIRWIHGCIHRHPESPLDSGQLRTGTSSRPRSVRPSPSAPIRDSRS